MRLVRTPRSTARIARCQPPGAVAWRTVDLSADRRSRAAGDRLRSAARATSRRLGDLSRYPTRAGATPSRPRLSIKTSDPRLSGIFRDTWDRRLPRPPMSEAQANARTIGARENVPPGCSRRSTTRTTEPGSRDARPHTSRLFPGAQVCEFLVVLCAARQAEHRETDSARDDDAHCAANHRFYSPPQRERPRGPLHQRLPAPRRNASSSIIKSFTAR